MSKRATEAGWAAAASAFVCLVSHLSSADISRVAQERARILLHGEGVQRRRRSDALPTRVGRAERAAAVRSANLTQWSALLSKRNKQQLDTNYCLCDEMV